MKYGLHTHVRAREAIGEIWITHTCARAAIGEIRITHTCTREAVGEIRITHTHTRACEAVGEIRMAAVQSSFYSGDWLGLSVEAAVQAAGQSVFLGSGREWPDGCGCVPWEDTEAEGDSSATKS